MDTTLQLHKIHKNFTFHWFDRLLALAIVALSLFMLMGAGGATSAFYRDVDARLGLLQRNTSYAANNIIKVVSFMSIEGAAQREVGIKFDLPRILSEALQKAAMTLLSSLIQKLMQTIFGLFDQLLKMIEGFMGAISGLQDALKPFLQALSMKVFALTQCFGESAIQAIQGFFGQGQQGAGGATANACAGGGSGATGGGANVDFTQGFNSTVSAANAQVFANALTNIAVGALQSYASTLVIPGTQSGNQPNNGAGAGGNPAAVSNAPTQTQVDTQINQLANAMAAGKKNDGKTNQTGKGNQTCVSNICFEDFVVLNNAPDPADVGEANRVIQSHVAQHIQNFDRAQLALRDATPGACAVTGYITPITPLDSAPRVNLENSFGFSSLDPGDGSSYSALTIANAGKLATNSLTPEQCENSKSYQQTVLAATQSKQGESGGDGFDFGAIASAIVEALTKFITQLIEKLFSMVTNLISKFLSALPGGQLLANAFGGVFSTLQQEVTSRVGTFIGDLFNRPTGR
jgi:hypothetical protein